MTDDPLPFIRAGLDALCEPGQVVELRLLGVDDNDRRVDAGYFDDLEVLATWALKYDGRTSGTYVTLNPPNPALLARYSNRVKPWAKVTTTDADIDRRRWLPLDFDPVRPALIPATEEEHQGARERARACRAFLTEAGWPLPAALHSGNGVGLLYRVELPNDEASLALTEQCLAVLAERFNDERVHLDVKVANAARIWRLPGTLNIKGDGTPDRPRRRGRVLEAGSGEVVPRVMLEVLARHGQPEPHDDPVNGWLFAVHAPEREFDLARWLAEHHIEAKDKGTWQRGPRIWEVACLNGDHADGASFVGILNDGRLTAGCLHNHCTWNWHDLRERYEPKASRASTNGHGTTATDLLEEPPPVAPPDWVTSYESLPFPLDVFPPELADFIRRTAESTCVDPAMVATFMLPVLGAALGDKQSIRIKSDWVERARIYSAVVSPSGTKKSPVLEKVTAPLQALQRDLTAGFAAAMEGWELEDAKTRGPQPKYQAILQSEATIEVFARDLAGHPHGVLLERDEITAWLEGFAQYKNKGNDRQHWLEFWSGKAQRIRRVSLAKPIDIPRPFVCVTGGIQPGVVGKLAVVEDGFAQRFLYCIPTVQREDARASGVNGSLTLAYENFVRGLYLLPEAEAIYGPGAQDALLDQLQRTYDEKYDGALSPVLREYWAKTEAYLARFTLLLAVIGGGTVTLETVTNATLLMDYYRGQAIAVFGDRSVLPAANQFGKASPYAVVQLTEWLRRKGAVTAREARKMGPRSFQDLDTLEAEKVIAEAAVRGWIKVAEGPRRSRILEAI